MTYADAVSRRILDLCQERNITLNKLATLSGLKQSTLDNVVKRNTKRPNLRTLHRISQGFGMTIAQFLDFPELNEGQFEDE
jgi:transcriptional regulator with XRE-family HTH domain